MLASRTITALFAVALVAACSREDGRPKLTAESAAGTSVDTSANVDETRPNPEAVAAQTLLTQLADRDETMLEMARLAVTRHEQLQVSTDARRILSERRKESNKLLGTLKGEYQVTHKPEILAVDQPVLDSLNGGGVGEFDRLFIAIAARRNAEDAQIIDRALPHVTPKLREMLTAMREGRSNEAKLFREQSPKASAR